MKTPSTEIREALSKFNIPDDLIQEFADKVEARQRKIIKEGLVTRKQKTRRRIILTRQRKSQPMTMAEIAAITIHKIGRNC